MSKTRPPQKLRPSVLVDAHSHFHSCFDLKEWLDSAASNLALGARETCPEGRTHSVLVVADIGSARLIQDLRSRSMSPPSGSWSIQCTRERFSVVAEKGGERLFLVSARQIATSDRLEVLRIGNDEPVKEDQPLQATIRIAREGGSLPVVPWGFGKWAGSRRHLVQKVLEDEDPSRIFLGDNGGRLRYSRRPRLFIAGERKGIRVLPGSDPLPFPRELDRVGSYGFILPADLDEDHPAQSLVASLARSTDELRPFGRRVPLRVFVLNQVAMQLRKRRRLRSSPDTIRDGRQDNSNGRPTL